MTNGTIGDNSVVEVDHAELTAYLEELSDKLKVVSEATGTLRTRIKEILEHTGWHKGALASIRAIDAMSETARADYLRTFSALFDAMMAHQWEREMEDLLAGLEDEGAQ